MIYIAMTTPHPYRVNKFPTPYGEVKSIHCVDGWPVGSVNVIGLQAAVMRHVCLLRVRSICNRRISHRDQSRRIKDGLDGELRISHGVQWAIAQLNQRVHKSLMHRSS